MTIIFKTRDGRTVETTDKKVLIAAAKNGEIGPDAVISIDGAGINAGRIKELVFGAPAPAPKPDPTPAPAPAPSTTADPLPKPVRAAFDWLTNAGVLLWWLAAFVWVLAGCAFMANDFIGVAVSSFVAAGCCIYNAFFLTNILKILEYIAVNVTEKKND
jgi:hypothetical protein